MKHCNLLICAFVGVVSFFVQAMSGDASVISFAWDPPTANTDGSPLEDLAGYKLYVGAGSRDYADCIDLGNTTATIVSDLTSGVTYYFSIKSYNSSGVESDYAEELTWRDLEGLPSGWQVWEAAIFGEEAAPNDDCDGDGYSNLDEFITGNSPTNEFCNPALASTVINGGMRLQFVVFAADGAAYDGLQRFAALHKTMDLTQPNWAPVPGYDRIPGAGQVVNYEDHQSVDLCYFRLVTWLE